LFYNPLFLSDLVYFTEAEVAGNCTGRSRMGEDGEDREKGEEKFGNHVGRIF
jgi:hypothetical protein